MNSNQLVNDNMTLEEKLAAIDKAVASKRDEQAARGPGLEPPKDPYEDLMCEGCQ